MRIIKTIQPSWGPSSKPHIVDPVIATLAVPVYYVTERGPVLQAKGIVCARAFAQTVLRVTEDWAMQYGFGLAHIGVYNPRKARLKNGSPITPERWSNHAYAEAWDFKGITDPHGELLDLNAMIAGCPKKLLELVSGCRAAIVAVHRRPEIVDEGRWEHIGMFPA